MSDCASLTLQVAEAPSLTLNLPATPALSFYAATQIPGLALPITAFEDISGSCFVCVTAQGLVAASSFPVRPAHAYIRQPIISGASVYVEQDGLLNGLAGLTVGALYFVHQTGGIISTQPTSGISQSVGTAVADDTLAVQLDPPIFLAA